MGRVVSAKSAKVSNRPTAANAVYADAVANAPLRNGDGVRTARRGSLQIGFNDKSVLRLSELTELIVQDSPSLRRLQLAKGSLWVRVTKGSNTAVQTPVATATVRGTEFLMDEAGNLAVREGMVELEANGFTIEVNPGEIAGVGPDGKPFKKGIRIPTEPEPDPAENGVPGFWFRRLKGEPDNPGDDDWLGPILGAIPLFFLPNDGGGDGRSPGAVPEPATVAGLALGAAAIVSMRKRKR